MRGHPVIGGHFLRTDSISHFKQDVMNGHLSCRDTCHVGTPVM